MSKLHAVDCQGRHMIITKTNDDVYEDISDIGIRIYSRHSSAWVILDVSTSQPICFLDIPPDDQIIDVYRGRWLVVRQPTIIMNVAGRSVDYDAADEYIFDIDTSRKMSKNDRGRLCGSYLSRDEKAISMVSGAVISCSFMKTMDLLDYVSISGTKTSVTDTKSNALRLGTSPASPSFANMATHVYVMRKKGSATEHVVYTGSSMSSTSRLSPILQFTGVYWQAHTDMIAYNNQVSRLAVGGRSSDVILTFDSALSSHGLVLSLVDVYFISDTNICLLYRSANFDAIIIRELL